jgi:dihydroorotate dehydrogenase (NAD+) catalytic subunit
MNKLSIDFLDFKFKNPIIAASGTFAFGEEYAEFYDVNCLGGISFKGLTLNKKDGNNGIRIWECESGMLNSIGLENPGIAAFIKKYKQYEKNIQTIKVINMGGNNLDEYTKGATLLNKIDFDILELNISCPNVKSGGMAFGVCEESAYEVTKTVKQRSRHKVMAKLSPNVTDITAIAKACEEAGADALSLINTVQAMAVDIKSKTAVFDNVYAGLSGACIKPIALRMVHQVSKAVKIPIMGIGGIYSAQDVLEFMMVGASCVQVGTANFINPMILKSMIKELEQYCEDENLYLKDIINII